MTAADRNLNQALAGLPPALLQRSGRIFYSGPAAFAKRSELYILGLNPGGSPTLQEDETIASSLASWRKGSPDWSAYLNESWCGKPAGAHGLQPRMRHMFEHLGLELRDIPASNVVFARSATEAGLEIEKATLLRQCWPVHEAVLRCSGVRTILCLGRTAGRWVRQELEAHQPLCLFVEENARGWINEAHLAPDGRAVITLTHPGRAEWRNPAADPTVLVRAVLQR